jgi:exodeoxyribonuclease VII small subunit
VATAKKNTASKESNNDLPVLDYEAARAELEGIVRQLESGNLTLEQSLALWQRGEEVAAICQQWLDGAMQQLEKARENLDSDLVDDEDKDEDEDFDEDEESVEEE